MITMQPLVIDTRSSEPSYRQLARQLRDAVTSGEIEPDEALPSLNRIKQETGLAPGTIQRAIGILVDEGIAYTVPGRGTFAGRRADLQEAATPTGSEQRKRCPQTALDSTTHMWPAWAVLCCLRFGSWQRKATRT